MKARLTETTFKSLSVAGQLFNRVACFGAIALICASASAQNLFVSANDSGGGKILKFTWDGVQSTFASGLSAPYGLAFDSTGNLFVAAGGGQILKFTPGGVESVFATGLDFPIDLAFDSMGNLFVADYGASYGSGNIYKFTPDGVRTIFASLNSPEGLAFDATGNLFVGEVGSGRIYKFTPDGTRTTFSSGFGGNIELTCDVAGNVFVSGSVGGNGINVWKITPEGVRTRFATGMFAPASLGFDSAGNLFVVDLGLTEAPSAIYKFKLHGKGKLFAAGEPPDDPSLEFNYLAVQP
jgi:sugar lactone lactonase YvrE